LEELLSFSWTSKDPEAGAASCKGVGDEMGRGRLLLKGISEGADGDVKMPKLQFNTSRDEEEKLS
jgi:hypothetical protein